MADDDNNLLNYMNDKENENKDKMVLALNTTEIPNKTDYDTDYTFVEWDNILEKISVPYPAKDKIPILKINNKDCFFNGEKITQIQLPKQSPDYDNYDNIFNKCKKCSVNYNKYFCKKCRMNICAIYYPKLILLL